VIYALSLLLSVELFWFIWGGGFNNLHSDHAVSDWGYFLAMFPGAAILDYLVIQGLLAMTYSLVAFRYILWLVCLFAVSLTSHVLGAIGFLLGSENGLFMLSFYDAMGSFILAAEIGVFLAYGLGGLYSRCSRNSVPNH
jgi:hypothetical protein